MPLSFSKHVMAVLVCACAVASAEEPPMPTAQTFVYPRDIRMFRSRALRVDGLFAPDIAFAVRDCPSCKKTYVYGNFPRLRRQPWDSLAMVQDVIESNVVKKPPPRTMMKAGKHVARACPVCSQPEGNSRPDKILFSHVIPETGDDLQIEFLVQDRKLAARKYFLVQKDKDPVEITLKDESEESVRKAYGAYFSLRALWNETFAAHMEGSKPVMIEAGPGMYLLFRPKAVSKTEFQEFCDAQMKGDAAKFDHIENLVPEGTDQASLSDSYIEWSGEHRDILSSGRMEGRVGISMPRLYQAMSSVLASRNLGMDVIAPSEKDKKAKGVISKGQVKTEVNFGPLAAKAAQAGLTLHQASALYLTNPAFALESAYRISEALKARRPDCTYEINDGRFLVLRDKAKVERKIDVLNLADKLDPENQFLFDLYCEMMLAWDPQRGVFGPEPNKRDVAPTGLPAFIERRVRPVGHLAQRNLPDALYEPSADSDGNKYDLCYTSECSASVVYVDPTRERFKGMTLEEARKIYDSLGCALPMWVDSLEMMNFPGVPNTRAFPCSAAIMCGMDLASLGADNARATALSHVAGYMGTEGRVSIYAFSTNVVALTPRRLTEDELKLVKSRMKDFVAETRTEPGLELGLHFDLPRTEPRGKVLRRSR